MEKKMGQKNGQEKRQKTKAEYKNISREELMQEISGQENARTEEEKEARKNAYHAYVSQVTPSYSLTLNMLKAFLVGGIICCIGQGIMNFAMSRGLDQMNAREMDQCDPGADQCNPYRAEYLSYDCKIRWCGRTGSYHGICKWRGSTGDRV